MLATIVAVVGTLLGGIVATLMQARIAKSARQEAREDLNRTAKLDAVAAVAAAVADHRRTMWLRESLRLAGATEGEVAAARGASHGTRSAITAPLVRLQVLGTPALDAAATVAVEASYALRNAADTETLDGLREAACIAEAQFVRAAGQALRVA